MGITVRQANQLIRDIKSYTAAAIADSWRGSGDPADTPEIEKQLEREKKRLRRTIEGLVEKNIDTLEEEK